MVTIVKHEWHQVDVQYAIEIDEDVLSEIYPDLDEDEIAEKLQQLADGEIDPEEVVDDAYNNDVDINWDHQYDDNWTMRKGGYDVTYELGDESSWHHEPPPPEPTHKCTKCKWKGQSYDADWKYDEKDENGETKKVCPYCESDTELTEEGFRKEEESKEWRRKWAEEHPDDDEEIDFSDVESKEETYNAECTSCTWEGPEEDTITIEGQMCCPDCREPVWTAEQVLEQRTKDLQNALEELKAEFEQLMENEGEETPKETNEVPVKWPFERPYEGPKKTLEQLDQEDEEVLPNYPAGEYTIRIWGRTREIGVGTISKAQYDYWSSDDRNYGDLSDALNENFDYDEEGTPEEARFDLPYYEYQDVKSIWGFDEDDTSMTITNQDGEEIYSGDVESFVIEAHGENDSRWDASEEIDELYPSYLGKGTFVVWTQGGKGSCIQTTIVVEEGEEFDPRKFRYKTYDIQGSSIISRLEYDGVELDDEGMDSEHDNWRGQWSEFNVYENEE